MKLVWKVISIAIAVAIVGIVFFKSEIIPDDYVVVSDEKSFTLEELPN